MEEPTKPITETEIVTKSPSEELNDDVKDLAVVEVKVEATETASTNGETSAEAELEAKPEANPEADANEISVSDHGNDADDDEEKEKLLSSSSSSDDSDSEADEEEFKHALESADEAEIINTDQKKTEEIKPEVAEEAEEAKTAEKPDEATKTNEKDKDNEDDYINILLLGETGVGKSTFINSFANYLLSASFEDAKATTFLCLIPTKFAVMVKRKQKVITFGDDKNEDKQLGNSSTQGAKAYVFPMKGGKMIRIIDTPGIGDARGTFKDNENFDNILFYIGQFKHLHAICFLLKPNVTVINPYFKFCIIELLSHLDKSAAKNMIFMFTNTRGSDYKPMETLANIRRIVDDIKKKENVQIPLRYNNKADNNVFCFENEGFKHLVALKQGIKQGAGDPSTMEKSWNFSQKESWNLIRYIMGDKSKKWTMLTPHKVQDTMSVNEARRYIIELSKPLADISDLIQDNLNALEKHKAMIAKEDITVGELQNGLHVPVIDIEQIQLPNPVTVCTASKCSEIYTVLGNTKYHYKQRCHNPCGLQNVPKQMIGSPELVYCAAMHNKTCKMCGCDFSTHMHIYYESRTVEVRVVDTTVQQQIHTQEEFIQVQYEHIRKLEEEQDAFKAEHAIISKSLAKFAHFWKNNSICAFSDAYEEYLQYLIQREETSRHCDKALLQRYRSSKKEHIEQKRLLEAAEKRAKEEGITAVSSEDVINSVQQLFTLERTGKKIRQLHMRQRTGSKMTYGKNTEYVHPTMIQQPVKRQPQPTKAQQQQGGLGGSGGSGMNTMNQSQQALIATVKSNLDKGDFQGAYWGVVQLKLQQDCKNAVQQMQNGPGPGTGPNWNESRYGAWGSQPQPQTQTFYADNQYYQPQTPHYNQTISSIWDPPSQSTYAQVVAPHQNQYHGIDYRGQGGPSPPPSYTSNTSYQAEYGPKQRYRTRLSDLPSTTSTSYHYRRNAAEPVLGLDHYDNPRMRSRTAFDDYDTSSTITMHSDADGFDNGKEASAPKVTPAEMKRYITEKRISSTRNVAAAARQNRNQTQRLAPDSDYIFGNSTTNNTNANEIVTTYGYQQQQRSNDTSYDAQLAQQEQEFEIENVLSQNGDNGRSASDKEQERSSRIGRMVSSIFNMF